MSNKTENPLQENAITPFKEIIAYEALWENRSASFKSLSELFSRKANSKPSDFVPQAKIEQLEDTIRRILFSKTLNYKINLLINGTFDYPEKLRSAQEPVEVLYYSGDIELLKTRSVAIVGSRKPSEDGLARTSKLVKLLVKDGFTIVSGLAQGIDTKAHKTALEAGGKTIAVIGTPLNEYYPKENEALQNFIAKHHLLVSQVPFYRYTQQNINGNRLFFPERNKTMSALTEATIIIEASDTSGTLIQAKAALQQGRKLFILESCFHKESITWPARFEKLGAIRVRDYDDIKNNLKS